MPHFAVLVWIRYRGGIGVLQYPRSPFGAFSDLARFRIRQDTVHILSLYIRVVGADPALGRGHQMLAPLTVGFFDVDRHPLEALGIVSGTLVLIGALIWRRLRIVI